MVAALSPTDDVAQRLPISSSHCSATDTLDVASAVASYGTVPVSGASGWANLRCWPLRALRWYLAALENSPLWTTVITSTVLSAISDLIAQSIELAGTGASYAWRRVFALALVGLLLTGPVFHYVYEYLEAVLPIVSGLRGFRNLVLQVAADQLIAQPVWLVGFFVVVESVEIGRVDFGEVGAALERGYFESLMLTWTVFPVCQMLSFGLLPSSMRVLVLNVVDIGYTAGLSYIKHR